MKALLRTKHNKVIVNKKIDNVIFEVDPGAVVTSCGGVVVGKVIPEASNLTYGFIWSNVLFLSLQFCVELQQILRQELKQMVVRNYIFSKSLAYFGRWVTNIS